MTTPAPKMVDVFSDIERETAAVANPAASPIQMPSPPQWSPKPNSKAVPSPITQ